jgi:4-diphosphocytidyl-2-C-methyl-D-erythritol kinase
MSNTVTRQAYAKINLFLDITGRRPDGYHTIAGVMQSVSLCDDVTVTLGPADSGTGKIFLTCSNPALPTDRGNLGFRAAEAFLTAIREAGIGPEGAVHIYIQKRIPSPAGLAGGSADAAAVLHGLNQLYGFPLTGEQLSRVGLSLGADVPFCLSGGTSITEGVGEKLTPTASLPSCHILIACAGEGVSTPWAYGELDRRFGGFAPGSYAPRTEALGALLASLEQGDLSGVGAHAFNLFETVVLSGTAGGADRGGYAGHAIARQIRGDMEKAGAVCARMSGSGPSVFGLFSTAGEAEALHHRMTAQGIPAWLCHPVPSPDL